MMTCRWSCSPGSSIVGGLIDLPFAQQKLECLDRWLEPVFRRARDPRSTLVRRRASRCRRSRSSSRSSASSSGRAVYRNGLDADGDDPGRRAARRRSPRCSRTRTTSTSGSRASSAVRSPRSPASSATASTATGIDGAVNGIGRAFRGGGGGLRKVQTGLVRNYALGDRVRRGAAARVVRRGCVLIRRVAAAVHVVDAASRSSPR